jgi:hypothetical protein
VAWDGWLHSGQKLYRPRLHVFLMLRGWAADLATAAFLSEVVLSHRL